MSSVTQVETTTEIQEVKSLRLTCTSGNDLSKPTNNSQTEQIPSSTETHVCGDCSDEGSCVDCGKLSTENESNGNNTKKESETFNMSNASKKSIFFNKTKTATACNADEENAANNSTATRCKNKNLQPRYKNTNLGQNQNLSDNCDSSKKKPNTNNAPSSSCKNNVSENEVDNSVRAARQESIIDIDGCHNENNENETRSSDTVKIAGDNYVEHNEVSMDHAESLSQNSLEIGATGCAPNQIQNENMVRTQLSQNEDNFQPMSNTLDLEVKVLLQKLENTTVEEDLTNSTLEADAAALTNAVMFDTRRIREVETDRFRNDLGNEVIYAVKDFKEELKAEGAAFKKDISDEMDLSTKLEFTRNSMYKTFRKFTYYFTSCLLFFSSQKCLLKKTCTPTQN